MSDICLSVDIEHDYRFWEADHGTCRWKCVFCGTIKEEYEDAAL